MSGTFNTAATLSNSSFYILLSILSCLGNWWNWWSTWWWKRCSGGHLEDGNPHLTSYLVLCSALLIIFGLHVFFSPYQTSFCITWFVLLSQINAEKSNNSDRSTNGEETQARKASRKSHRTAKLLRPVSIEATLFATIFFVFKVYYSIRYNKY